MHASVAKRRNGSALKSAAVHFVAEVVAVIAWLVDYEQAESAMLGIRIRVRSSKHHERIGSTSKRAPGLDTIDTPATLFG